MRLLDYNKQVFWRWNTLFTVIPSVLLIVSKIKDQEILLPNWAWLCALGGSLYMATFGVYSKLLDKRPKAGEIRLSLKKVTCGGGGSWSGSKMPPTAPIITFEIEARNRGEEPARLMTLNVGRFDPGSSRLDCEPIVIKCAGPSGSGKVPLPLDIPGTSIRDLRVNLPVRVKVNDLKTFVETIREADKFRVTLSYRYEDLDGASYEDTVDAAGDYLDFKDQLLNQQLKKRYPDLAFQLLDDENRFKRGEY